jgi:hypothetical protein
VTRAEVRAAERRRRSAKLDAIGLRAVAYMAEVMDLHEPATDQEQNHTGRHLAQFAHREVAAERRRIRRELLKVGVIREGFWVQRASVIEAIKKATRGTR